MVCDCFQNTTTVIAPVLMLIAGLSVCVWFVIRSIKRRSK